MGNSTAKNTIEENYISLFDLNDEEDIEWSKKIRLIPPEKMKSHLFRVLEVINSQEWSIDDWSLFKYELLKDEKRFNGTIFKSWGIPGMEEKLGVSLPLITLNWDMLEGDTIAMFCVHMMIENFYCLKESLPSVWDLSKD